MISSDINPDESSCHMRSDLSCSLDQSRFTHKLSNPAERARADIWWLERDGSNMVEAVENIAQCFVDQGISWFQRCIDLKLALADVELERDCYVKYYRASYLAKELGLEAKHEMYAALRDAEIASKKCLIVMRRAWYFVLSTKHKALRTKNNKS